MESASSFDDIPPAVPPKDHISLSTPDMNEDIPHTAKSHSKSSSFSATKYSFPSLSFRSMKRTSKQKKSGLTENSQETLSHASSSSSSEDNETNEDTGSINSNHQIDQMQTSMYSMSAMSAYTTKISETFEVQTAEEFKMDRKNSAVTSPIQSDVTSSTSFLADMSQAIKSLIMPSSNTAESATASPTLIISPEKRKKYVEVRKYILGELLQTERNYVNNLDIVLQKIKAPLVKAVTGEHEVTPTLTPTSAGSGGSSEAPHNPKRRNSLDRSGSVGSGLFLSKTSAIIPLVDIKIIFAFVEDLWNFNKTFCHDLESTVSQWDEFENLWGEGKILESNSSSIGKLFSRMNRDWDIYLKFVDNYASAKEAIRRSEENSPNYRSFMSSFLKNKEYQRQGLGDFLIFPIQRVTRYVLLLQDLKKHTPSDHPEYINIIEALEEMRQLANTVNEVKRREEEMTKMFHVVGSMDNCPPTIISAQRRILHEANVFDITKIFSSTSDGVNHSTSSVDSHGISTKIFVFTDLIMIARPKTKKKKDSLSKYMTLNLGSGENKKDKDDKMLLERMTWFHNLEIVDISEDKRRSFDKTLSMPSLKPSNYKHIIKIILHNSDTGNPAGRRKFWNELAAANAAATSSSAIGPRSSSRKARSINEEQNGGRSLMKDTKYSHSSMPTSPVDYHHHSLSPIGALPTVESIEKLAMERLNSKTDPINFNSTNPSSNTLNRAPTPRTSSLTSVSNAGVLHFLKNNGPEQEMAQSNSNAALVAKRQSSLSPEAPLSSQPIAAPSIVSLARSNSESYSNLSSGATGIEIKKPMERTLSLIHVKRNDESQSETFIVEFQDRKEKTDFLLIVEKLAMDKKIRYTSSNQSVHNE